MQPVLEIHLECVKMSEADLTKSLPFIFFFFFKLFYAKVLTKFVAHV